MKDMAIKTKAAKEQCEELVKDPLLNSAPAEQNIEDLIELDEIGPEPFMLKTYLNQVITITGYTDVRSELNIPGRRAISITFVDSAGESHTLITGAKYLIQQLDCVKAATDFTLPTSKILAVKGRLIANVTFGKYRNFRLEAVNKAAKRNFEVEV